MYRITQIYGDLQGLLQVEGLKTFPSSVPRIEPGDPCGSPEINLRFHFDFIAGDPGAGSGRTQGDLRNADCLIAKVDGTG